jgi:hypothetical protein
MQTTHNPLIPHTILINHAAFANSPYQSPAFYVNVEPQPNTP